MNNNIEEDIKMLDNVLKCNKKQFEELGTHILLQEDEQQAIENILADRERLIEENRMLEENYQLLIENVSYIAKELNLEEDATIDEIIVAIRKLQIKANKYDSLVEKIRKKKEAYSKNCTVVNSFIVEVLQELLDTKKKEVGRWKK